MTRRSPRPRGLALIALLFASQARAGDDGREVEAMIPLESSRPAASSVGIDSRDSTGRDVEAS